jgi:hypothetical protein
MVHELVNIRSSHRHFICICRGNIRVANGKNSCCCVAEKIVNSGEDNKQVYELIHLVLLNAHICIDFRQCYAQSLNQQ